MNVFRGKTWKEEVQDCDRRVGHFMGSVSGIDVDFVGNVERNLESWELVEVERRSPEELAALAATHPGFRVQCVRCGGHAVGIASDLGHSDGSGLFGNVYLACVECGASVSVLESGG